MRIQARVLLLGTLISAGAVSSVGWISLATPPQDMATAAGVFLDSLGPELRARAALPFDDPARTDWHYIPRDSAGIEFAEMIDAQRSAARDLVRSALSSRGVNKLEEIMLLDTVLRELERGSGPRRDPLAYSVAVFGTPSRDPAAPSAPWGWKIEGHHVSLNFTVVGDSAAVTPSFLGANPARVLSGDRAGVRVLAAEEDLARELLSLLTPDQHRQAVLSDTAPADILAVPGRSLGEIDSAGLPVSSMHDRQRALVVRLLNEFAGSLRHELAEHELDRISAAGLDNIRFAWMGGSLPGQGHYYRLAGPTFVIEYDNTQNQANHVHTLWRDRTRDFGDDLLRQHYTNHHAPQPLPPPLPPPTPTPLPSPGPPPIPPHQPSR